MSLSKTKSRLKTYARCRSIAESDNERSAKRRRVETSVECLEEHQWARTMAGTNATVKSSKPIAESGSSSPAPDGRIFSDGAPCQSPPSSSPLRSPEPASQTAVPRKPSYEPSAQMRVPLKEGSSTNLRRKPTSTNKKSGLVQMKIDLGWQTRKTCKVCGMEYVPSNDEDTTLHKKFHAMNVGGVDLEKAVVEQLRSSKLWSNSESDFICAITRHDNAAIRNRATKVLSVVNADLSAISIADDILWSQSTNASSASASSHESRSEKKASAKQSSALGDRFKVFLYIRAQKCVGLCLAERIQDACTVLDPDKSAGGIPKPLSSPTASSSITVSIKPEKALLGISRIWTSSLARKQNVASTLLDCATENYLYGMVIEKEEIAFSQPTESGCHLARKWFGKQYGWHVYVD